jgi:hypothetical protein
MLTNDERCPLVSAALGAVIRRPAWSPRRSCRSQRPCPRRAGRSPGWAWPPRTGAAEPGWAGCGIPSISLRATTRHPEGRARQRTRRFRRGLPSGRRAVGLRQIDGRPHVPQRATSKTGSSPGRRGRWWPAGRAPKKIICADICVGDCVLVRHTVTTVGSSAQVQQKAQCASAPAKQRLALRNRCVSQVEKHGPVLWSVLCG